MRRWEWKPDVIAHSARGRGEGEGAVLKKGPFRAKLSHARHLVAVASELGLSSVEA